MPMQGYSAGSFKNLLRALEDASYYAACERRRATIFRRECLVAPSYAA
jgi:hypothetical protein